MQYKLEINPNIFRYNSQLYHSHTSSRFLERCASRILPRQDLPLPRERKKGRQNASEPKMFVSGPHGAETPSQRAGEKRKHPGTAFGRGGGLSAPPSG